MISYLRGKIAAVTLTYAVVEVGGVGMQVFCPPNTLATLRTGSEAQVFSSLVVREDSLTLYGFATADERDMFELVQTASGVGPKVAQAMIAVFAPDRLRSSIAHGDLAALTAVPGIGRKGAERIVLELKDKVGPVSSLVAPAQAWRDQVHEALLGLGWPARDADRAVESVAASVEPGATPDISALLRDALRTLSKT
ncbi:MAG: Holliday junction branch migration protein RuvA [Nocardioidaceae bacterium]|nr:Holliday junction branch migration protein RuvA [Nocardioidaceae bacterium]